MNYVNNLSICTSKQLEKLSDINDNTVVVAIRFPNQVTLVVSGHDAYYSFTDNRIRYFYKDNLEVEVKLGQCRFPVHYQGELIRGKIDRSKFNPYTLDGSIFIGNGDIAYLLDSNGNDYSTGSMDFIQYTHVYSWDGSYYYREDSAIYASSYFNGLKVAKLPDRFNNVSDGLFFSHYGVGVNNLFYHIGLCKDFEGYVRGHTDWTDLLVNNHKIYKITESDVRLIGHEIYAFDTRSALCISEGDNVYNKWYIVESKNGYNLYFNNIKMTKIPFIKFDKTAPKMYRFNFTDGNVDFFNVDTKEFSRNIYKINTHIDCIKVTESILNNSKHNRYAK